MTDLYATLERIATMTAPGGRCEHSGINSIAVKAMAAHKLDLVQDWGEDDDFFDTVPPSNESARRAAWLLLRRRKLQRKEST